MHGKKAHFDALLHEIPLATAHPSFCPFPLLPFSPGHQPCYPSGASRPTSLHFNSRNFPLFLACVCVGVRWLWVGLVCVFVGGGEEKKGGEGEWSNISGHAPVFPVRSMLVSNRKYAKKFGMFFSQCCL